MKPLGLFLLLVLLSRYNPSALAEAAEIKLSKQTKECLDCHSEYHPGLVQDWLQSLHSKTTPEQALTNKPLARRISSENIPENLKNVVVGCYECHRLNATNHTDNFEHFEYPRHGFSIEIARKPFTCSQCHMGPDVPAWEVYNESKHGNIFLSKQQEWNWDHVPWRVGVDFRAPTCAVCHSSLITSPEGNVIAQRTHDFGARLWVRLFGLPYSHPQPKTGDTTLLRNKDGQPLPSAFTGERANWPVSS